MPTYQYACTDCADRLEVVQKFTDDSLTVCASCGGRLRKVYSPVGIVFKGSGFYRTDSRAAAQKDSETAKTSANGSDAKKSGADSSSGDKSGKSDKKSAETVGSGSSSSSSGSSGSSGSSSSSSSSSSGSKVA